MVERHVLGLSGGRDSAALAVFMRQHFPDLPIEYFFTDTGKELPEVYEFLGRLEGFLGKQILRLNSKRDFDFWHREYGHFLPSAQTRWCTRQLKLKPFKDWIGPDLESGIKIFSYVAIRADEPQRVGMHATHTNLEVLFPLREHDVDKAGVNELLNGAGLGLPEYYRWRSRSGCTFCFYQQKIEWVRLREEHPDKFDEAKQYEKTALEHGSPFTWSDGESLNDLERPERIAAIKADYEKRIEREKKKKRANPLRVGVVDIDIDTLYGDSEISTSCIICHK